MTNTKAAIIENQCIAHGIYRMVLECPDVDLRDFVPGQFADIEIPGHAEMLLKRPFSINAVDVDQQTVTIIYQVVGKGTGALAQAESGTVLSAILPIGEGFKLSAEDKSVMLVGGGVGIAPLLSVVKRWPDKQYSAYLGYRSKENAYCTNDFKEACFSVNISSDDGTIGTKCFVTDLVTKDIAGETPDVVLACGPTPMLRALKSILAPRKIRAQFSLEQRMACGFGACATCVCGIQKDDGLHYKKVCTNGPVFDMDEVVL